jgi:hypothetical protein
MGKQPGRKPLPPSRWHWPGAPSKTRMSETNAENGTVKSEGKVQGEAFTIIILAPDGEKTQFKVSAEWFIL